MSVSKILVNVTNIKLSGCWVESIRICSVFSGATIVVAVNALNPSLMVEQGSQVRKVCLDHSSDLYYMQGQIQTTYLDSAFY